MFSVFSSILTNFQRAPLVHMNFPEKKANGAIGPYEFPLKLTWTDGSGLHSMECSSLASHREAKAT